MAGPKSAPCTNLFDLDVYHLLVRPGLEVQTSSHAHSYCGGGVGEGLVLSSTLFAPLLVACAPLWTIFFEPFFILCPVFLTARPLE